MMSGVPFETCWAFNKLWNNKFYYKAASCWYFYWVNNGYFAWRPMYIYDNTSLVLRRMTYVSDKSCRENKTTHFRHHHHHHHVYEGLGVFPVPWSSRWNWSLHLFLGRPMCLRPFGLYCNACFGILFVSILCMCCSHFSWYCFVSFTIFCAPVFSLNTLIFFFI